MVYGPVCVEGVAVLVGHAVDRNICVLMWLLGVPSQRSALKAHSPSALYRRRQLVGAFILLHKTGMTKLVFSPQIPGQANVRTAYRWAEFLDEPLSCSVSQPWRRCGFRDHSLGSWRRA